MNAIIKNIEAAVNNGLISETDAGKLDDLLSQKPISSTVAQQILASMKQVVYMLGFAAQNIYLCMLKFLSMQ